MQFAETADMIITPVAIRASTYFLRGSSPAPPRMPIISDQTAFKPVTRSSKGHKKRFSPTSIISPQSVHHNPIHSGSSMVPWNALVICTREQVRARAAPIASICNPVDVKPIIKNETNVSMRGDVKPVIKNETNVNTRGDGRMSQDGKKKIVCHICHKEFTRLFSLKMHSYLHQACLPYQCHYCDKQFTTTRHRDTHARVHTGERPFPCLFPGCTSAFTVKSSLRRHQLTCTYKDRKEEVVAAEPVTNSQLKNS